MPGCAEINWSNSAKKGFLMKRFPRDPSRRKEWLIKTRRDHWTPTDYSCLCEIHFAPEMWERPRVDDKKFLKSNAVPTMFSFVEPKPKRNPPVPRKFISPKKPKHLSGENIALDETVPEESPEPSTSNLALDIESGQQLSISKSSLSEDSLCTAPSPLISEIDPTSEIAQLQLKLNRYKKLYGREKRRAYRYKKTVRATRKKLIKKKRKNSQFFGL